MIEMPRPCLPFEGGALCCRRSKLSKMPARHNSHVDGTAIRSHTVGDLKFTVYKISCGT